MNILSSLFRALLVWHCGHCSVLTSEEKNDLLFKMWENEQLSTVG